jgi:hypothetical protein
LCQLILGRDRLSKKSTSLYLSKYCPIFLYTSVPAGFSFFLVVCVGKGILFCNFWCSKAFLQSQALAALLKLIRPYNFFGFLLRLFPLSISNFMYRIVAKNRYRWFGKYDRCPVLPGKFKNKLFK